MKLYRSLFLLVALSFTPAFASATIITFEESPKVAGATPPDETDVISNGFLFDALTDHSHLVNNYMGGDSGSTFFGADDFVGLNTVTMTTVGGGSFDIFNLDLGNWFTGQESTSLRLTGFYSGGGSISTDIGLGTFSTYNLFGWVNLSSVVFDSIAGAEKEYWGVDNINVGNSVPEPASLTLFGLGLLGMSFFRRRLNNA